MNLIYKYVSRTDFLQNGFFRFTQPNELNDPFEVRPRVLINKYAPEDYERAQAEAAEIVDPNDLPKGELEAIFMDPWPSHRFDEKSFPGLSPYHRPDLREEPFKSIEEFDRFIADTARNKFIEEANKTIGIFCLTRNPHSLLMWAHYANGHKGMLLAFNQDHDFFKRGGGLYPVEYRKEPVSITSMGGLRRFCGLQFEDSMQFYIRALLRKHTDWEYEDEFRMFLPLEEFDERVMHNPSVHLFHIPTEALREIILGARMSEDDANVIRKIVSEDPRWGHVRLFHAELNEQDMPLNYLEDKGITGH